MTPDDRFNLKCDLWTVHLT